MSKPQKRRRRRSWLASGLPKGAYRLPCGGYARQLIGLVDGRGRRIAIVAVRRDPPDLELLAKAFVEVARQQLENEVARDRPDEDSLAA